MRKCEICGKEVYCGDSLYSCAICGAKVCSSCVCQLSKAYEYPTHLCPAHYAQVKEYIEGLKGTKSFTTPWVDTRQEFEVSAVYVNGKKFVPEADPTKLKNEPNFCVRLEGTTYHVHSNGPCQDIETDIANALYEHMRRERGRD